MPPKSRLVDADSESLISQFVTAQQAGVLEIVDQGLVSLARLVETNAIDVSPQFQRRDRWDATRQSRLIESFLTNIPVPPVYLAEDAARLGSYAVIDGKQRLTAISSFFSDRLVLRGLTRISALNGLRYSDLPPEIANPLGMKNLRVTTLLRQTNEDLKHEVFLRLNTGGEILNPQEIRNVAYRGPLNDLIYNLAENVFLRQQFKVTPPASPSFRQMADAEFVLRFFTLAGNWRGFRGELKIELDRYMVENRQADFDALKRLERLFLRCIETSEAIWGKQAFKRPGRDQALSGLYDAEMVALAECHEKTHGVLVRESAQVRKRVNALFDDVLFEQAVRLGTNTPERLRYRTRKVLEVLESVIAGSPA